MKTDFSSPSLTFSKLLSFFSPQERIALISLGCARNLVDSETLLAQIRLRGGYVVDVDHADTVIVNTCAFITDAKKETIDTLQELIALKKKKKIKRIVALGCFAKRYADIFKKEFPEIDFVFGIVPLSQDQNLPRALLTPSWHAYVKICESCYNHCSFCAIPGIKGKFISRRIESVIEEVKALEGRGVREINVIGQDITAYGFDLKPPSTLSHLLEKMLSQTKRIHWIRLLYAFPRHVGVDLLELMSQEKRICSYLDIPLQHINDRILTSMNRRFTSGETRKLIEKIRQKIPQCSLRTAFIVGYPGETDKEFKELCQFVEKTQFDHVGVFEYSQEEGTKAAQIKNQIPGRIKRERYNTLMKIQQPISAQRLQRFVGQRLEILLEEKKEENLYVGRSPYDAPEADGIVYVKSMKKLRLGDFVHAKVIDSLEYDLIAQI